MSPNNGITTSDASVTVPINYQHSLEQIPEFCIKFGEHVVTSRGRDVAYSHLLLKSVMLIAEINETSFPRR